MKCLNVLVFIFAHFWKGTYNALVDSESVVERRCDRHCTEVARLDFTELSESNLERIAETEDQHLSLQSM
jgi:hypothetical protein